MADYSARIELLISGLDKLKALEGRISALQRETEKLSKPIPKAGTAALAEVIEEAAVAQKGLNGQTERGLLRQIKLNAAVRLYERRLAEVGRTAAASQKQFAGDIQQIQDAFEVFKGKGSIQGVQAVATELGRIVEYSREVTRLEVGRVKSSEQIKAFAAEINQLKAAGLDVSKAEKTLEKFSVNAGTNKFKLAEKYRIVLNGRLTQLRNELRLERQIANEQKRKTAGRKQKMVGAASSALIGAGFPLLFGQGAGAAVGGGVGGLAGGLIGGPAGFALSIVGTVFGNSVDQFIGGAQKAGQALGSTSKALEFMREKSIFSSEAVQEQATVLEEQGKVQELATLLTKDLVSAIGNRGVQALQDLGKTTNETTRLWNTLTVQLQALIAGPLNAFLKLVNSLLKGATTKQRFNALAADMQGNAEFAAAVKARKGGGKTGVLSQADMEEVIGMFESKRPKTASIPVTGADLRDITAPKAKGQSALESSQRRTAALKASSQALFMSAVLQDRIAAAERIGAKEQALALTRRRDQVKLIGEYDAKIAKVKETENSAEEIAALRQERNVKLVAQQLKYENESLQLQLQRKAAGYEITSQLQKDTYLLEAKLSGKEKEAALELEIARQVLAANDPARSQEIADSVRRKAALQEQIELAADLKNAYSSIALTLSQGVSEALKGVVKGTQSLRDAAFNILDSILSKIIDISLNMAFFGVASGTGTGGGLLGGLFKANGGPVMGGSPYIVGERGPELFVPGQSGTIVPNNKIGGSGSTNVVVNVSAGGSNVEGDQQGAKQLGQAVAAAVQQELIKQKRPGGLLA